VVSLRAKGSRSDAPQVSPEPWGFPIVYVVLLGVVFRAGTNGQRAPSISTQTPALAANVSAAEDRRRLTNHESRSTNHGMSD